jgi:hypothetical protein
VAAGYSNTTGYENSFFGESAGYSNTTGYENSFFGVAAGHSNTTGSENSFFGVAAGHSNTSGDSNSFFGRFAGYSNTTGSENSFFGGNYAGRSNTTGYENSFFGNGAGYKNTTGYYNSFFGRSAGSSNTTGHRNSFFGRSAGSYNTTGYYNSFFGIEAGDSNTVEDNNTFIGAAADLDPGPDPDTSPVENATAVGYRAQVSQSNSLILGSIAGLNGASDSVNVGIGTAAPSQPLHVRRNDGTARLLVEEAAATTAARTLFHLQNDGRIRFTMENTGTGKFWSFTAYDSSFAINHSSSSGAEFRLVPSTGNLEIKGEVHAADFVVTSDRNLKEAFAAIDSQQILDKVASLPITEWEYKADKADTRHLGPVAQDFRSAFGLGRDDRHINAMDGVGVSLAAIKGLYQRLEEKDAEIEHLKTRLAEIEAMMKR